jgi:hypothetical protein
MIKGASLHHLARSGSSLNSFHPTTDPAVRAFLCNPRRLAGWPECGLAGEARRDGMQRVECCRPWYAIPDGIRRLWRSARSLRATLIGGSYRQLSEFGLRKSAARRGVSMS